MKRRSSLGCVRLVLWWAVGLTVLWMLVSGCSPPFEVRYAVQIEPPALYYTMWDSAQTCTQRKGRIGAITFYVAQEVISNGEIVGGHYERGENAIYLLEGWEYEPLVIKHEMIHALGINGHPSVPFKSPCKATWETYGQ